MKLETQTAGATQYASGAHAVPIWLLGAVLVGLLILTFATVAVTYFDLGRANLWIALAIATAKVYLVALYFMHLRWDRPFYGVLFLVAVLFVMLFVGLALVDTITYHPELIPGYAPGMGQ